MGIINNFFGMILNLIFEGVSTFTDVGTLGFTIIIFTLVAQLLLTPLKFKQQRTTRTMSKIQPEMQRIQKKYANKDDQASKMAYSAELQSLYKKYNMNPLSGCLPLLIQFPLIIALYSVLRQPSRYIDKLGELYTQLAVTVEQSVVGVKATMDQVLAQIPLSSNALYEMKNLGENAQLSDTLSHFTTAQWDLLQTFISPEGANQLEALLLQKHNYEYFLVNLVDSPSNLFASGVFLAVLVPIVAGASTFIFSKVTMASSKAMQPAGAGDTPNSADSMMKVMNIMMPIMMGFFSWTVASGLALYWVTGNIIMMFQQMIVNKIVDKEQAAIDEQLRKEREAQSGVKKKKKKKKRPEQVEGTATEIEVQAKESTQEEQQQLPNQSTKKTSVKASNKEQD